MSTTKKILRDFADVFGGQRPAFISRACGRVELIGGHTDYNEGFVIASSIDKCCRVAASKRDDRRICIYSELFKEKHEFGLSEDLKPVEDCRWANYGRGVAVLLLREGLALKGANLYVVSEVPAGAGLSSSAAMEVSLAKAMIFVSVPEYAMEKRRLAEICQKAENIYANSPCGIMDQTVSIVGKRDSAVFLDCRDMSIKLLPFDSDVCRIMIFNSMVRHDVGGGEYGERRRRCEQVCAVVRGKYPQVRALRDVDETMLSSVKGKLDSALFDCASHVVAENARVLAVAEALKRNNIVEFGKLMYESHCSARDLYKISCEQTDFLVEHICRCDGAYGARISGGGFGGSVVALVQADMMEKIRQRVHWAYKDEFGLDSEIYMVRPWESTEIVKLKESN